MKFKLDENLGSRCVSILKRAGHDVETVFSEGLSGASDLRIFAAIEEEHRCLITLDLDFSDVLRFPPHQVGGIAVLRTPQNPSMRTLEAMVANLLRMLSAEPIEGRLWIVEANRIRVHQNTDPNDPWN
jgi:predicted nuclease of predicted toxin-antitoxin system